MKNETTTTNKSTESSQGDDGGAPLPPPPPPPPEQPPDGPASRGGNMVLKSGPLFISSKGIGWTSWKKRWFILTKTSLVFFRSDPSSIPQKGSEVNLTLGGIDLNNSGSVNVKADKKLLTVLFPDGRAFTLKAETSEDLHEWKSALEEALSQAPSAALVMGQNGIFKNEQADGADGSSEQLKDKQPAKSLVIGRPILLALEDVDGSPSFLEKALRFIEDHGVKVEGILRQAADVDDVMHRIWEYEHGKTEFSGGEDAHVIADCVKYFLREMPSSPVPASCCNALLEACHSDRSNRVNAMRVAICETFPEPNRRLLQRILLMMQTVASHKTVNRMSTSAVAACMAPLLLRPLLGGECEIATDFDVGGDGSMQLLQAAAAANHAQAIVITLLEEYQTIFSEGTMSPGLYSDSEEDESEGEEVTDDDEYYEDDEQDDGTQESDAYTEDDPENALSGSYSESGGSGEDDLSDDKGSDNHSSRSNSLEEHDFEVKDQSSSGLVKSTSPPHDETEITRIVPFQSSHSLEPRRNEVDEASGDESSETTVGNKLTGHIKKSITLANDPGQNAKRPTVWGRTSAKKNLSMESMDCLVAEELEIQKLEALKIDLQNKIAEEVKGNAVMLAKLEQRKRELHECRLALEKDVAGLQDQLQKERDKRAVLEVGLNPSRGHLPASVMIDEKLKRDLEEITQAEAEVTNLTKKFDELSEQINQRHEQKHLSMNESSDKLIHTSNHRERVKDRQETEDFAMPPLPGKSTSKDPPLEGAESRDGKKPESDSITGKHGHEKQQQDSTRSSNPKSTASTHSKRSGTRTERGQQGGNSTSSALTKLTNRLNFLKERRSQIANELLFLDKGKIPDKGLTSPGKGRRSDLPPSPHNLDKGQGPEVPSSSNVEKSRGSGRPRSSENAEKVLQVEGQSYQDSDKSRKVDSQLLPNVGGRQPESQHPQVLDRGKSEGHVSYNSDKVKGSGSSKTVTIPRTNSR